MKLIHEELREGSNLVFRIETSGAVQIIEVRISGGSREVVNGILLRGNNKRYIYRLPKTINRALDFLFKGMFPTGWKLAWGPDWRPYIGSDAQTGVRNFLENIKDKLE